MENQIKFYEKLLERVRTDENFKQRFVKDPKSILAEMGVKIPDYVQIEVHEDKPTLKHLVIPAHAPDNELSESELMMVAGGLTKDYDDYVTAGIHDA